MLDGPIRSSDGPGAHLPLAARRDLRVQIGEAADPGGRSSV